MTVSANYDIDVFGSAGQFRVSGLVIPFRISDMGHSHYQVAFLLVFQKRSCVVGALYDILKTHPLVVGLRDY